VPTRYRQLRQAIARLALGADDQHAYLESILGHLTPDGDATCYGNDELAMEFGDIYRAAGHMRDWGEINEEEIAAARPLDELLKKWSCDRKSDFWRREALWTDPGWEQVRRCAHQVLNLYPDEDRPSAWVPGMD
jgi:hypothetical protein